MQQDRASVSAIRPRRRQAIRGLKNRHKLARPSRFYREMNYYERWIASMEAILIEKGILKKDEIDKKVVEFEKEWGEP